MDYPLCASSWLVSIILTLASISSSSGFGFWGGERKDLEYVCSQTSNPQRCTELFRSDYRSSPTDIRGLTEIAIELAYNKAQQLKSQVNFGYNPGYYNPGHDNQDYNNPGYDYGRGTGYKNRCTKYYNKATEDLEKAREYLSKGEYRRITSKANHALKQVSKCRDVLGDNGELELLCEMVQISSKRLNRDF